MDTNDLQRSYLNQADLAKEVREHISNHCEAISTLLNDVATLKSVGEKAIERLNTVSHKGLRNDERLQKVEARTEFWAQYGKEQTKRLEDLEAITASWREQWNAMCSKMELVESLQNCQACFDVEKRVGNKIDNLQKQVNTIGKRCDEMWKTFNEAGEKESSPQSKQSRRERIRVTLEGYLTWCEDGNHIIERQDTVKMYLAWLDRQ